MTRKFWIGVIARDHALMAQKQGVCAFSHGKETAVAKLSVGDEFLFYAPKTGVSEGDTVQAFVAHGAVTGDAPYQKTWADTEHTAWVRTASYKPVREVPVKPMLDDLDFVTNPRYWGMAFRRSLFEITQKDFDRIAKAMQK